MSLKRLCKIKASVETVFTDGGEVSYKISVANVLISTNYTLLKFKKLYERNTKKGELGANGIIKHFFFVSTKK